MTAVHCPPVISVLISHTSNSPFPRVACGVASAIACSLDAQACGDNITLLGPAKWKRDNGEFAVLSKQVQ